MTDPTIDEMLEWLRLTQEEYFTITHPEWGRVQGEPSGTYIRTIRALLEQHRHGLFRTEGQNLKLEAIRAFVERVARRYAEDNHPWSKVVAYMKPLRDELAAMEKENESSS